MHSVQMIKYIWLTWVSIMKSKYYSPDLSCNMQCYGYVQLYMSCCNMQCNNEIKVLLPWSKLQYAMQWTCTIVYVKSMPCQLAKGKSPSTCVWSTVSHWPTIENWHFNISRFKANYFQHIYRINIVIYKYCYVKFWER